MNKDFVHVMNECMYFSIKNDTIANQIYHVIVGERKKKLVKLFICSHMLVENKPMTNYESMSKLLHFLHVKNFPKSHCSNIIGWEMAVCMQQNQIFG
jgi:F420-dependent methylenetetrahydromethanopterin dehydrogenase